MSSIAGAAASFYRFEDLRESENEFVRDCQRGDAKAWEHLVRRHSSRIYAMCRRFTGRVAEAQDLTQEVLLRVFRMLHSFRADEISFAAWLNLVTRNLLIDHYRRSALQRSFVSLDSPGGVGRFARTDNPARAYEHADLRRHLHAAISELPADLAETVSLYDLHGLSYTEIASHFAVPVGTVKSRLNRGRRLLADSLRRKGITKGIAA